AWISIESANQTGRIRLAGESIFYLTIYCSHDSDTKSMHPPLSIADTAIRPHSLSKSQKEACEKRGIYNHPAPVAQTTDSDSAALTPVHVSNCRSFFKFTHAVHTI